MCVANEKLEIQTLGVISIKSGERLILAEWPDDLSKMLFCTLISPLEETITMEQLCSLLLNMPATQTPRRRIAAKIDNLIEMFEAETGINPFLIENDQVGIDYLHVHVDAYEFYQYVQKGFRLTSNGDRHHALSNLQKADLLYYGKFLPGMFNSAINKTREELEKIHGLVVKQISSADVLTS
jgi:hypothetical protein